MTSPVEPTNNISVFCSYADDDQRLQGQLEKQLRSLERRGLIFVWHRHKVHPGQEPNHEVGKNLREADLILLLISQNFIDSEYCYSVEMKDALERHLDGKARIVPILLRPCVWEGLPFSIFQVLPRNKKPVILWSKPDAAFQQIVQEVETVVHEIRQYGHGYIEPLQPKQTSYTRPEKERTRTAPQRTNATQRGARAAVRNNYYSL